MRRLVVRAHLYAALGPSLFLVLTAGSGVAIMLEGRLLPPAFLTEQYAFEVADRRADVAPILEKISRRYGTRPHRLSIREDPAHADQYRLRSPSAERDETVIVNPYTGEILEKAHDFRTPLSRSLRDFHLELLTGTVGGWLVGGSTAILLVTCVTGIALVISAIRRLGLSTVVPRLGTGPKSYNYKLHQLLGVTFVPILLCIAATGCYLAFEPVERAVSRLLDGAAPETVPAPISTPKPGLRAMSIDAVLERYRVLDELSRWGRVRIELPEQEADAYRIEAERRGSGGASEFFVVDQYTGERIDARYAEPPRRADSARSLLRSLHFGTVLGGWTEVLWLTACISVPVFVVSGTAIWWSKRALGRSSKPP